LFMDLRLSGQLLKKPATAELISWLTAVRALSKNRGLTDDELRDRNCFTSDENRRGIIEPTLNVLLKNDQDTDSAKAIVDKWARS
jgi:hypothetical protein